MNNRPKSVIDSTTKNFSISASELGNKVRFSYPQSSVIVLGDYRGIQGVQETFNNIILNQFRFSVYIFDEVTTNDYAQYLLNSGYLLNEINIRDISESNIDSDLLNQLLQKNERLVISMEEVPQRLRKEYWKALGLSIRSFFLEKSVPVLPYFMVWIDKELTFKEPDLFEDFRILGLWGEEYGLRFNVFYDQYALLSSPSRTLFGIISLFPGLPDTEVEDILKSLSVDIVTRNQLYKLYCNLGMNQMLVVSPSDMFEPFLVDFI